MDSLWLKRGDDITEIRATFFTDCRVILTQIRDRNFSETYIKSRPNTHARLFGYCSLCLLFICNGKGGRISVMWYWGLSCGAIVISLFVTRVKRWI